MNTIEHLWQILGEECAEVIQVASKANRFGANEVWQEHENQSSNAERVILEFNQVIAMIEMLDEAGEFDHLKKFDDFSIIDRQAIKAKKRKVLDYLEYSAQMGRLESDE